MRDNEGFLLATKNMGYIISINKSLKEYTSLKIGGNAHFLSEPYSIEEIQTVISSAKHYEIPYHVIGNGSNILVMDEGFDGLVIVTKSNFNQIEMEDETTIRAQSGIALADVCLLAYHESLTGIEFAWGIPASVGGACYMNAGAYGGEIKDILKSCTFLDEEGNLHTFSNEEMQFSYRHSYCNDKNMCILEATFSLSKGDKEVIKKVMDDLIYRRASKQPLEYPSAGSTFKRPVGNYASKLISECGLKGYRVGDAMISEKHAGFVINYHQATSEHFLMLIDDVRRMVKEETGFVLEPEIKMIGNRK